MRFEFRKNLTIFIFLLFTVVSKNAFSVCGDLIIIPMDGALKADFIQIQENNDVAFELNYPAPFDICNDKFSITLVGNNKTLNLTRGETENSDGISFVIDNKETSLFNFYIEIDKKRYKIYNKKDITLSLGPNACANNKNIYLNMIYVDAFGLKKFSHGHCPNQNYNRLLR